MSQITRRDFLKTTALSAAALSSTALEVLAVSRQAALQRKGPPKKVIVIGAGLAGLSAAYELTQAGHDVTILEAQMRSGGRVLTLREPFSDGLYEEAGATSIPDTHNITLRYIQLFGIPLSPGSSADLDTITYHRGKRIRITKGTTPELPYNLTPEDKKLGWGIWPKYRPASVFQEIGHPAEPNWSPDSLRKYDQMSYAEFLRSHGAYPEAIAFMTAGTGSEGVSALAVLRELAAERGAEKSYRIRGGCDLLPGAFAERLKEKIRYGSPVVKIEHNTQGVLVTFLQAEAHQKVEGDHLVCTIPFSVLRQIEISPPFSRQKHRVVEQLPYRPCVRVFLQSRKRFWLDEGLDGKAWTDLPIGEVASTPSNQPGPRGVLQCYATGLAARRLIAMKESERIRYALEQVEKVYPGIRENFEGGTSKCWDEDPWARGCSSSYKPGQMSELWPYIARPEGRVHFAGDHTSAWNRWMQGALESGIRAAREVNEAP